jgi:hypothetical protein
MVCRFTLDFFKPDMIDVSGGLASPGPEIIFLFMFIFSMLNSISCIFTLILKSDFNFFDL